MNVFVFSFIYLFLFFFFYPFIDGQCYIAWEIICSKCEWLLQVRMFWLSDLVRNLTLQYMAMLFSIKKHDKMMGQKEIKGHLE